MKPKRLVIVRFRQGRQKWEVDYLDPRDSKRYRPLFDTESAAHERANKVAQELTDGVPVVADRDVLLKGFAPSSLEAPKPDISARTSRSYKQSLDHYALPRLGKRRVRDPRPRPLL